MFKLRNKTIVKMLKMQFKIFPVLQFTFFPRKRFITILYFYNFTLYALEIISL